MMSNKHIKTNIQTTDSSGKEIWHIITMETIMMLTFYQMAKSVVSINVLTNKTQTHEIQTKVSMKHIVD